MCVNLIDLPMIEEKISEGGLKTLRILLLWGERGSNPHDVTIDGF